MIVRNYADLYRAYAPRYRLDRAVYAIPRIDRQPEDFHTQYRGLDRDALDPYDKSEKLAEIRLSELEETGDCIDGFVFDKKLLESVVSYLENPEQYEVIWSRIVDCESSIPKGYSSVGFEPTYFSGDHFSASCDCMMIPRWHGSDEHGTLFKDHFEKLNRYGLFQAPKVASEFLEYYLSFDWTETGDYQVAEVCLENARL